LEATQEMEMLMEHLFIQDLNQLLLYLNQQVQQELGKFMIVQEKDLMMELNLHLKPMEMMQNLLKM
jgi:hypothetical protein